MGTSTKPRGGPNAKLAAQLGKRADFRAFHGVSTEDEAAQLIRDRCCIKSRAELDHDAAAERLFHVLLRKPFVESRV